MQDFFQSVRRSLSRPSPGHGRLASPGGGERREEGRMGSFLRRSRVGHPLLGTQRSPPPRLSPTTPPRKVQPAIRWKKGELIGSGAFGQVFMGMNLDSGELLAVKQVLIAHPREKAQAQIRELEEEINLLKNLSHPNIVRYLGTTREEDTVNILLEFVPGGSISSLLGKFGPFAEPVIRKYTKQLLQGLAYLHENGIIHRDIKGGNILVDDKGGIKLTDFGASKQVANVATIAPPKSMKGTAFWMAPEVIVQTGHNLYADIWSVGCTVIEMATGEPPWCRQFQFPEAALYHIGATKSHPPIPNHLSSEAKEFLLQCFHKEPLLRATASDLLMHSFVTCEGQQNQLQQSSVVASSKNNQLKSCLKKSSTLTGSTCENRESLTISPPWDDSKDMRRPHKDYYLMVGSSINAVSKPDRPSKFGGEKDKDMDATISDSPYCDVEDKDTESRIKDFIDGNVLFMERLREEMVTGNLINPHNESSLWKEELNQELERSREKLRQTGGKASPKNLARNLKREAMTSRREGIP